MTPVEDFVVALLDLIAFFFVTPIVLGEERLYRWNLRGERIVYWLRTVWFNRDLGQLNPGNVVPVFVSFLSFTAITVFKPDVSSNVYTILYILSFAIPMGTVVVLTLFILLSNKLGFFRALALSGACTFVAARLVVLSSALHRMWPSALG